MTTPLPVANTTCSGDCPDCKNRAKTTKIVVGVDNVNAYRPALNLIERLSFPNTAIELVHVAAETLPFAGTEEVQERYSEIVLNLGHVALHEATGVVCSKNMSCEGHLMHGNAAEKLIEEAETRGADLIAVNTKRVGVLRSSYIGSVARALAIGSRTSVLIAKGEQSKRMIYRAVFATDHSPFAERCLARFIELAPKGLEEIHVATAWDVDDREAELLGKNLPMLGGDADRWIEETVRENNEEVCRKLEAAGYKTRSVVRRGRANDVIHEAMAEARADLLIVGSQGHGAMSRTLVGSVSLHQSTAEFYPVLIVRPRES